MKEEIMELIEFLNHLAEKIDNPKENPSREDLAIFYSLRGYL